MIFNPVYRTQEWQGTLNHLPVSVFLQVRQIKNQMREDNLKWYWSINCYWEEKYQMEKKLTANILWGYDDEIPWDSERDCLIIGRSYLTDLGFQYLRDV